MPSNTCSFASNSPCLAQHRFLKRLPVVVQEVGRSPGWAQSSQLRNGRWSYYGGQRTWRGKVSRWRCHFYRRLPTLLLTPRLYADITCFHSVRITLFFCFCTWWLQGCQSAQPLGLSFCTHCSCNTPCFAQFGSGQNKYLHRRITWLFRTILLVLLRRWLLTLFNNSGPMASKVSSHWKRIIKFIKHRGQTI